jgi:tetratricopeptide (TPR) repeat protein
MIRGKTILQVLGIYAAASWAVLEVVDVVTERMGLPEWVFPFALVLLLIGLPILLATSVVQSLLSGRSGGDSGGEEMEESVPEAAGRLFTWRNAILGGVLAFSLLFGLAGLAVLLKEKVLSPDEAVAESAVPAIAILPFVVRGDGLDVWREGMVDLMSTNLDGAAGLRTIAGRTVLARWKEARADERGGDLDTALGVARATGASYALVGSAIAGGQGMRLTADLYDAQTGEALGDVQVEGPADSVFVLVDRLSVAAVREIATTGGVESVSMDLAGVTTSSVDALKAYLEGMSFFRRSDFPAAAESFSQAIDADSTFALAYLRLGDCYGWMEGTWSGLQREAHHRAALYKEQLPRRERILLEADLSVTARRLVGLEDLREYVQVHPDDADAAFMLGELYLHRGHNLPVSREEMERVFTRAVELDPSFGPYHSHLVDVALWTTPDSAYVAGLMADARRASGGSADPLMLALAFGGDSARSWALARLDSVPANDLTGLNFGLRHPRYWDSFELVQQAAYRRAEEAGISGVSPDQVREVAMFFASTGARQAGQVGKALDYINDSAVDGSYSTCFVSTMYHSRLPVPAEVLERYLATDRIENRGPRSLGCLATYAIEQNRVGDLKLLKAAIVEAGDQAATEGESETVEYVAALLEVIEGYRLWRSGDPAAALPLIEDNYRTADAGIARLWIGQIYADLSRPAEAVKWLGSMWGHQYTTIAYLELGRAYEALGEPEKAVVAYAEFIEAWERGDPEVQPMVEAARARLEDIVRERG